MNIKNYVRTWIRRDPIRYHSLHSDMISARSGITVEQYIWRSIKFALLTGVFFAIVGYFASEFFTLQVLAGRGISNVVNIQIPDFISGISSVFYIQGIVVAIAFVLGSYTGYSFFLKLPGVEKNSRAIKINLTLHNAVAYMYAMRRGGAQLMPIFRSLSHRADIYGEVALEFRQIVRDADFFGYDVVTAIRHLTETTPSEKLKDFLEDLLSVI